MQLILDHVSVRLGSNQATIVDDVSIALGGGDIGVLMGPSGCGKTTLIRAIAGLERISHGHISVQGETLSTPTQHRPAQRRQLGMVFQDYALFPHLSVADNVGFGLRELARDERDARVHEVLTQVHLNELARRMPHQLSGGQQQRVALARALAPQPRLLLMDEPFSNLDRAMREALALELRDTLKATGVTVLVVTHDLDEAFALGDRVGVMRQGHLLQWDTAPALYNHPNSPFVAEFTGPSAWLRGHTQGEQRVDTVLGTFEYRNTLAPAQDCRVLLRASDLVHDTASPIRAEVVHRIFRGDHDLLELRLADGQVVLAQTPSDAGHSVGSHIGVSARITQVTAMASEISIG
jgi:iron(III) transport system ATP-binding protein